MASTNQRRLHMSNTDSGVDLIAIDVSSTDQTLATYARGVHCNTAGNLVFQTPAMLAEGLGRTATIALLAGTSYQYDIAKIIKASTTAAGYVWL